MVDLNAGFAERYDLAYDSFEQGNPQMNVGLLYRPYPQGI